MTAAMPIPGLIDPVPVPRPAPAGGGRARRAGRPFQGGDSRRAGRGRAGRAAGEAARQAALAPDLQSRRHQLRRDERHRQAAARLARRALRDRPAGGGARAGLDRRHPQMAAEDRPTATISRWSSSPTPIAARSASRARSAAPSNCRFCYTGTMRLVRNLNAGEIVGQVMLARDSLGEWPSQPEGRMLSNIVMMGMGEPLYNFDNVRDALKIVMDGDGLGLSRRRITLSTSGVVPMMARAGRGDRGQSRGLAARGDQGGARRDRAAQPQIRDRGAARSLRRLSRRQQCPADHLRICDAEGQERQRRGCARAGPADPQVQAAGQGEPDPVQPLAGRGL